MHIRSREVSPFATAALIVAVAIAVFYALTRGERESTAIPSREHSIPDRSPPPQARHTQIDLLRDDTSAASIPAVVSDSEYRGEVVDIEDDPVSNALISLLNMESRTLEERRSDAAGSFSFTSLVDEVFELVVEHPDYQVAAYTVSSRAELPARIVLTQGASLCVTVKCADAAALPEDLEVSVHCDPRVRPLRLQRTADPIAGEYRFFGLPELPASVSVFAPGYPTPSPQSVELMIGGTVECAFLLPARDALLVRVVDARNSPIPGANLNLSRSGPRGNADFALTDEFGMSFLNAVIVGSTLKVSAEGFAAQGVAIADSESELVVRLVQESIIDVVVLDADGAPAEDVSVSCTSSNARALPHYLDAKTLIGILDGACRLDGLAAGSYELSFSRDRKRLGSLRVELEHGEVERAEFVAAPFETFEGIVLRNGRPAGAGRLRSSDNEVIEVDNSGRFRLAAPSPLTIAPETWFAFSQGDGEFSPLRMRSQEGRLEVSFETRRLHGQVVAPSGEAVPGLVGVCFSLVTWNTEVIRTYNEDFVTDEHGRFDVELIRGQQECEFSQLPPQFAHFRTTIDLSADREIRLQLQAADTLFLRAFGRNGSELTALEVEAVSENTSRRHSATVAPTGGYYWPAWAHRGVVRSAGYVPREFDLADLPREAPIRVDLALGGTVRFQGSGLHSYSELEIDRLEGEALPAVLRTIRLDMHGWGSATLPAGRYQVKTSNLNGKRIATEFEVIVGETKAVELP